ncbi:2'-5' RNA ligase family protein [Polaromonas sp. YR568]|uniref:2'-5' RNA ligase family protein n=1 Tax=Polaromonas sp. YR568 TaxID=1855301 RepID=UPI00398BD5F5
MTGQSSFPGFEEAKPTDRLFLALFPTPETALEIAELAARIRGTHALRGRPLEAARFHITLNHLGDYAGLPSDVVRRAGAAAAEAAAATQPFAVTFTRAESFASMPRNRPLVLRGDDEGLSSLMAFHKVLGAALKKANLGQWAKPGYTPHVTLLYDDGALGATPVPPVAWTAVEVVLVHSLLGETRHVHLARWPLSGPPSA